MTEREMALIALVLRKPLSMDDLTFLMDEYLKLKQDEIGEKIWAVAREHGDIVVKDAPFSEEENVNRYKYLSYQNYKKGIKN